MKNKTLNFLKKAASTMLVTVMLVGLSAGSVKAGEPVDEAGQSPIVYEPYTLTQFNEGGYNVNAVAPEPSTGTKALCSHGYVFGGWFTSKGNNTYYPVLDRSKVDDTVYAKFVPAYVMSVKCQNIAGTDEDTEFATMKFVSAMDSSNYKSYNFKVSTVKVNEDGTFDSAINNFTSQDQVITDVPDKVYEEFAVYGSTDNKTPTVYKPNQLFGSVAKYFTTWGINNIKNTSFGNIVCIQPTWTTLDGTVVEGLTKYAHVEDGFVHEIEGTSYRYVNVPINLRQLEALGEGVAAGVLSIACTTEGATLKYDSVESGRTFEEMAWAEKSDNSVKLVGNTKTIVDKNANDVYANVRFLVAESDASKVITGLDFAVTGEDFSNSAETQFTESTCNVWDVKY